MILGLDASDPDTADRKTRLRNILFDAEYYYTDMPLGTLPKSHSQFVANGGYAKGGLYPPTTYIGIKGAEKVLGFANGQVLAKRYLDGIADVFQYSNTIWEMYAPTRQVLSEITGTQGKTYHGISAVHNNGRATCTVRGSGFSCDILKTGYSIADLQRDQGNGPYIAPSRRDNNGSLVKPDFVGWGALGPIALLIENIIGIQANAPQREIVWYITRTDRHGIENLWLGDGLGKFSLIAAARTDINQPISITAASSAATTSETSIRLRVVDVNLNCERTFDVILGQAGQSFTSNCDRTAKAVTVAFGQGAYTVSEGGSVTVTIRLSATRPGNVTIPITATNQGTTSAVDYSGVPANVTIIAGYTEQTFTFTATQDRDDDDAESVLLTFGASLPSGVSAGGTATTTVSITDVPILVSNTAQTANANATYSGDHGQAFTTGFNLTGYTVSGVIIISTDPDDDAIALQICEVDDDTHPTSTCTDLTPPSSSAEGPLEFTIASTSLTLAATTTYMLVFKAPSLGQIRVAATTSDNEGSASLPGWSIRDKFQWKNAQDMWADASRHNAIRIAILGVANPPSATAPTATDSTVTATEDTPYTFTVADFNFSSTIDNDSLASVRILILPDNGTLARAGTPVTANQSVTRTQLDAGSLVYTPTANANGAAYASFLFKVSNSTEASTGGYVMAIDVTAVQDPATGTPTISGTARVRQTLTASTAGIADPDGLPSAFTYQWKRYAADGITFEANIGTNLNRYTLTASEEGKKVLVEVRFRDKGGSSEGPLLSVPYPANGTVGAASLVSNTAQTANANATYSGDHGQAFTTGANAGGYTVSGVTIISTDPDDDAIALQICEVDDDTHPTDPCTDLTPPSSSAEGPLEFTIAQGTSLTLAAATTYMLVFKAPSLGQIRVAATTSDNEDSASLPGWSIRDKFQWKNTQDMWADASRHDAIRIAILGVAITPDLAISQSAFTVVEGNAAGQSYTVALTTQPSAAVTVTISGQASSDLVVDPSSLTFSTSNWSAAQTVTVTARDDADALTDPVVTLTHRASGGDYGAVTGDLRVTITDNDSPDLAISQSAFTVVEGNAAGQSYTVALTTQPSAAVTVTISGQASSDLVVDPSSLTFSTSNWSAAQTVTVTARDDADALTDPVVTLTHRASGGDYGAVTGDLRVTITDNDSPDLAISQSAFTVVEGNAAGQSYTVALETQPSAAVTVTISGQASSDLVVDPSSLTFSTSNWSAAQTVTVTARDDADALTDPVVTLTHRASGGDYGAVTGDLRVTITDNDSPGLAISQSAFTVVEGNAAGQSYTVALETQPSAAVTVTISGQASSDLVVDPSSLTFSTSNWSRPRR